MVGLSSTTFGLRWTELSVLGSQEFGQALMESCEIFLILKQNSFFVGLPKFSFIHTVIHK